MENLPQEKLLRDVLSVREKYQFFQEKTGARFNVYSVARNERTELVHSRMIAELLSPKGSHGQGSTFLKLFLQTTCHNGFPLDCEGAIVEDERSFSIESVRGRVDIIIELAHAVIIIENKIDTGDQWQQMARYRDYAYLIAKGRKIILFYLTPDRREPTEKSLGNQNPPTVNLLSYPEELATWLDKCLLYCVQNRLDYLTEAISQYRRLIDKISGNTMSNDQGIEVKTMLMQNPDNISAALDVSYVLQSDAFRGELLWNFLQKLQHELKNLHYRELGNELEKSESIKKFVATERNLINWCKREKNEDWECKGLFLKLPEICGDDLLCCVMFATDALHYGLVSLTGMVEKKSTSDGWEQRPWPKEMPLYSCIEDKSAYRFWRNTFELLSSPEKISALAKKINQQIAEVTG